MTLVSVEVYFKILCWCSSLHIHYCHYTSCHSHQLHWELDEQDLSCTKSSDRITRIIIQLHWPTHLPVWLPSGVHALLFSTIIPQASLLSSLELCNVCEILKAKSHAPQKNSLRQRWHDNMCQISFSLNWPFIWTPTCIYGPHTITNAQISKGRKMSLVAGVIDAMSWQQVCLMPEHWNS